MIAKGVHSDVLLCEFVYIGSYCSRNHGKEREPNLIRLVNILLVKTITYNIEVFTIEIGTLCKCGREVRGWLSKNITVEMRGFIVVTCLFRC